jgi:hypothetical protein
MNETIEYQEFLLAEQQARIDSLIYDYERDLSRLRNALKEIVAYKPLDGYDISEAYWDLRHIAHGALEADDE